MPMRRERACRRPQVPPHIRCAPSLQENASHDDVCNNNNDDDDDDDDDDEDKSMYHKFQNASKVDLL